MATALLEGTDLIVVLIVVLLLFGSTQLPKLARSLGQAKKELDLGMADEPAQITPSASTTVVVPVLDPSKVAQAAEAERIE